MKREMLTHFNELLYARLEEILPGAGGLLFCFDSNGGSPDPMDEADLASARNEHEISMCIRQRSRKAFQDIVDALGRVRNGEFGICEKCGSEIEVRRLNAQPTATVCIECKRRIEDMKRLKAA